MSLERIRKLTPSKSPSKPTDANVDKVVEYFFPHKQDKTAVGYNLKKEMSL